MTVINRSNIIRWTSSTRKRHANLQAVVYFLANRPFASVREIQEHMGWAAASSGRVAVLTLIKDKVIRYSHSLPQLRGSGVPMYAANEGAVALSRELYPTQRAEDEPDISVQIRQITPSGIPSNTVAQRVEVRRDPLTAFLMGTGRAPSLNFTNS